MKLLVPINNGQSVLAFYKAGANEFYAGFHDKAWSKRFGEFADLNRMSGFGNRANSFTLDELEELSVVISHIDAKLFVTLNANCYSEEQLRFIERNYFPVFDRMALGGVIIPDLACASLAARHGLPVVASTMCGIYNSDIAREYVSVGVTRIILPRDLTLQEIHSIVNACPGIEYEVFHMRNGCVFSDSHCLGLHRPECGALCSFIRYRDETTLTHRRSFYDLHDIESNAHFYNRYFHIEACAMCALYDFLNAGITSLKIVGRADEANAIARDILLTSKNIAIASSCSSRDEYLVKMDLGMDFPQKCRYGFSCYYPDIRWGDCFKNQDTSIGL